MRIARAALNASQASSSPTNLRRVLLFGHEHTDLGLIGVFPVLDKMLKNKVIDPAKTIIAYEKIPPDFLGLDAISNARKLAANFQTPASILSAIQASKMSEEMLPNMVDLMKYAHLLSMASKHKGLTIMQLDDPSLDREISLRRSKVQHQNDPQSELDIINDVAKQRQGHMMGRLMNHCFYDASGAENLIAIFGLGHGPEIAQGLQHIVAPDNKSLFVLHFSDLLSVLSGVGPHEHMASFKEARDQYYKASGHISQKFLDKFYASERIAYCEIEDENLRTFPKLHEDLIAEIEQLFDKTPSPSPDPKKGDNAQEESGPTIYL